MKRLFALLAVVFAMAVLPQCASAVVLQDWCFNVNGVSVLTYACNQGIMPPVLGAAVNGSGFDFSLAEAPPNVNVDNTLGSVVVTLGPGMSQYVAAYMDYDLNYDNSGSFQDSGTTVGGPAPAGVTWELDDPNTSNIFTDFANSALANTNNVGTYSGPPDVCCDVAWALGVNLDVATSATVTFTVSKTAPASGFYLEQTNGIDGETIYLSESVQQQGGPNPPGVPEPGTLTLLAAGLAGAFLLRRRVAA